MLVSVREPRLSRELLHIIAIGGHRRHPARRSVGLLQKSGVAEVRHQVADGGRTQPFGAASRNGSRSHRLPRRNIGFYDGSQDLPFPLPDLSGLSHTLTI